MKFCHIHMISQVEYFQNINKRLKKINNTFQHKFSILHGSIVDSLLIIYNVCTCITVKRSSVMDQLLKLISSSNISCIMSYYIDHHCSALIYHNSTACRRISAEIGALLRTSGASLTRRCIPWMQGLATSPMKTIFRF